MIKTLLGSAAGVYALVQLFHLSDTASTDGAYFNGRWLGGYIGLVVGWALCLAMLLTARSDSKSHRLLIDIAKILFGFTSGLLSLNTINSLIQYSQTGGQFGGVQYTPGAIMRGGVIGVVAGVSSLLLLWSAYRRRPNASERPRP